MTLTHFSTLTHRLDAWIRLDTGKFIHFKAALIELLHHLIIETDTLNRTTTVCEQHTTTIFSQFFAKVVQLILPEIDLDRNIIHEIIHITDLIDCTIYITPHWLDILHCRAKKCIVAPAYTQ